MSIFEDEAKGFQAHVFFLGGGEAFFWARNILGKLNLLSNFFHVLETNQQFQDPKMGQNAPILEIRNLPSIVAVGVPSREFTSPTWGRKFGKSSTPKWNLLMGYAIVPRRVNLLLVVREDRLFTGPNLS